MKGLKFIETMVLISSLNLYAHGIKSRLGDDLINLVFKEEIEPGIFKLQEYKSNTVAIKVIDLANPNYDRTNPKTHKYNDAIINFEEELFLDDNKKLSLKLKLLLKPPYDTEFQHQFNIHISSEDGKCFYRSESDGYDSYEKFLDELLNRLLTVDIKDYSLQGNGYIF